MKTLFKLKIKRNNTKNGFTIIELLFGISIFTIIVLVLTLFSRNIWIYSSYITAGLKASDSGRSSIKTMTKEIRTASVAETGAYIINQANNNTFIFYSDVDKDGLKERIKYFIENNTLKKGLTKPTGSPLSYNLANEKIYILVENIINNSIFEYYDKNYDGNTVPLTEPINIPAIRLVKINITTDENTNRSPAPINFSTQVSLRNLKDNL